jgi:hypothetical protein
MKTLTKFVLAGTALMGAAAANAQINVPPTTTGGSDLILFVTDTATGAAFVQDLGVNLDSLGPTTTSIATDVSDSAGYCHGCSPGGSAGPLNAGEIMVASGLISGGVDTALAAWESENGITTSNSYYSIIAGFQGGNENSGETRIAATYTATFGTDQFNHATNNSAMNTAIGNLGTFFADVNSATAVYDYSSGAGKGAEGGFGGLGIPNGSALGGTTYMYELSTVTGTSSSEAYVYTSSNAITIGTGGAVSGIESTTVPLPAALWLLGSGVLGLFGIGRRRRVTAAV